MYQKKSHRGPDGKVTVAPKNIFTNPSKKMFGKPYESMKDEFDRRRELEFKEHEEHKKKLQEQPFKSSFPGDRPFFSDKQTFLNSKPLPASSPKIEKKEVKYHDAPFKPPSLTKTGFNDGFNKFPEYKSDPIHIAIRKVDDSKKKDPFKPTNTADFVRPTPSISLNKVNLKHEMIRNSSSLF